MTIYINMMEALKSNQCEDIGYISNSLGMTTEDLMIKIESKSLNFEQILKFVQSSGCPHLLRTILDQIRPSTSVMTKTGSHRVNLAHQAPTHRMH